MCDALLYWDRLTCIVPHEEFPCRAGWPDDLQREADQFHETFVTGLAPGDKEKDRVHVRLEALLASEPPEWHRAKNLIPSKAAVMAVRKVSPRTLDMLSEHGWLLDQGDDQGLISRAASGLLLSALAEEMASETMPAVTNEPSTFRATCNALLSELQSQQGIGGSQMEQFRLLGPAPDDHGSELGILLARIPKLGVASGAIEPKMLRHLYKLCLDSGFDKQRAQFREQVDNYVAALRQLPVIEHKAIHDLLGGGARKRPEGLEAGTTCRGCRSRRGKGGNGGDGSRGGCRRRHVRRRWAHRADRRGRRRRRGTVWSSAEATSRNKGRPLDLLAGRRPRFP
jgi:hypothetical protein